MRTTSIRAMLTMLAVCFAVAACGVPATRTAADLGSDMPGHRDPAQWVAGIDSTQD